MNQQPHEFGPIDPDLRVLSERLDALGAADASDMPPELRSKVLEAVGQVYAPQPIAISRGPARWWASGGVRMAAAVALMAAVSALVYTASRTPPVHPGLQVAMVNTAMVEQRIEGLLALTSEGSDRFGDQVASIELWAEALSSEAGNAWIGSDLSDSNWWDAGWMGL